MVRPHASRNSHNKSHKNKHFIIDPFNLHSLQGGGGHQFDYPKYVWSPSGMSRHVPRPMSS